MTAQRVRVRVGDRVLDLSNLDKVLYPVPGFRKRDVIEYYRGVAEAMLPHLRHRPATLLRYPDGVQSSSFYEKDVARHAPEWVRTATLASGATGGGQSINHHVLFEDVPTLVWAANLAALELHVPQWRVTAEGERASPDLLVFDLDPGPPATIVECARLAERLRELLTDDGLRPFPKTSGSKGLQLYCAVRTHGPETASRYAKRLAERLAEEQPDRVVAKMAKALRAGKVFVDWSQNNQAKTTIAPYSLRAREHPSVSTPVSWREIRDCTQPGDLVFTSDTVLERLDRFGDLFAEVHRDPVTLS